MRFFTCFLSGWLLAAVLSAAVTPEDDLQKAQEEIAAGKPQDAARTLERLMKRPEVNDAMRERVIRVQMDGHLLEAAATSAERLVKRSGQSPPKVAHQKLLDEVMTAHVKELDRILAMKTWADVGQSEYDFSSSLPGVMRRAVKVDRAKTEAVLKHAYALLKQSPDEQNATQVGSGDGPANQYLMKMGAVPPLMRQVLELADASGISRVPDWSSMYITQMQGEDETRDLAHVFSLFQGTPIAAEVGDFRDLALPGSSWQTGLGEIASWFRWDQYSDLKPQVMAELASRKPRTFGVELTECLIGDEEDNRMMTAFLKRRREDLGRLTDEAASTMLALLGTRYYAINSPAPLDPALKELLNPLLEAENWHLDSVRFTWQKMKGFDELKLDPHAAALVAHHIFRRIAVRDRVAAQQFLEDGLRLFRTLPGKEGENGGRELLQEAAEEPEMLEVVLRLAAREGYTQQGDWLATTLFRAWRPGDHVEQPQRLITFLEAAGVLGNASDFTRYWRTDEPHEKGFLKRIMSTFAGRPSAGKVFLPVLTAHKPRTFGADVLQALLNPAPERSLTQVAALYRTELESLPSDRQAELARFFSLWVRDLDTLARAVPGFAPVLKSQQSAKEDSAQRLVDRVLQATQLKDLFEDSSSHEIDMRSGSGLPSGRSGAAMIKTAEAIAAVHGQDPRRAEEAFQKMTRLIESGETRGLPPTMALQSGSLGAWLLVAADHPALLPWVANTANRVSANPEFIWLQRVEERMFPQGSFLDPAVAVSLLGKYRLLVDVEAFSPQVFAPGRNQVELVVRRIRALPVEARAALAVALQKRQPASFGAVFFASLCQKDLRAASGVLEARTAEIARADGARKQMLLLSLNSVFSGLVFENTGVSREGAVGLLLKHEDELERNYLEALRMGTAVGSMLQPLSGAASVAGRELRRLLDAGDRAAAEALFERVMAEGGASPPAPPHRLAVFVLNPVMASTRVQTLLRDGRARMAGFVWQRLHADSTGKLGVPSPAMALLAADGLHDSWLDAGGWADAAGAARSMLAEFASGLKDAPPVAAAPVLGSFLNQVPAPCRKEILAWALAEGGTGPEGALIRELAVVGSLQDALQSGDKAGEERGWAHYGGKLAESPPMQLGLAVYWYQQGGPRLPASLTVPAARTAVDCWKHGHYLPVADFAGIFEAFANVPEDAGWEETAKAFAAEWKTHAGSARKGNITSIQPDSVHATLGILARLGDTDALDLCEQMIKSPYAQESWPVAVLAAKGQPTRAAAVLGNGWSRLAVSSSAQPQREAPASPLPAREVMDAFARAFQPGQTDLALLGEYALLQDSRPQRRDGKDAAAMAQWERFMADFVDRVARTPVQDAAVRRCLHALILRSSPRQLSRLAALIAAEAESAVPALEKYQPDTAAAWPVEVLALHAAARILGGAEVTVVSKDLQQINEMLRGSGGSASASLRSRASTHFLMRLVEGVAPFWPDLPGERRDAIVSAVGACLPTSTSAISSTDMESVRWLVDTWREASGQPPLQTAAKPSTRFTTATLSRLKEILAQMGGEGKFRLTPEFRLKWTVVVLNRPEMQGELSQATSTLPVVLESLSLLSSDEAVAGAALLVEGLNQGGRTGYELAPLAFAAGGAQKALEVMELAGREAQAAPVGSADGGATRAGGGFPARQNVPKAEAVLLRKAALLIRLGRNQEALTLLEGVPDKTSLPGKKGLQKLAAQSPAAAP